MKTSLGASAVLFPLLSSAAPSAWVDHSSIISQIHKRANPSPYDYTKDTFALDAHKSCTSPQLDQIKLSFAEAGYLANALQQWKPAGDYQTAMDMYMGTDSKDAWSQVLTDTIGREWGFHSNSNIPKNTEVSIYCDDATFGGVLCSGSGAVAISRTENHNDRTEHTTILCPPFWKSSRQTLGQQIASIRSGSSSSNLAASLYASAGMVLFHESWHYDGLVGNPHIGDRDPSGKQIYGPQGVADAAKQGGKVTSVAADAYTVSGVAMFLMQNFNLDTVPNPGVITQDQGDIIVDGFTETTTAQDSDFVKVKASDAKLDAWDYLPMPKSVPPTCDVNDSKCNYISSCGSEWMPVDDFTSGGTPYVGYKTVVNNFCTQAAGKMVPPKGKLQLTLAVGLDQGKDPSTNGKEGSVEFEIHNKFSDNHYVVKSDCVSRLLWIADATAQNGKCWGPNNKDTHGGTYQLGKDMVSYHALGSTDKHDELIAAGFVTDGSEGGDDDEDDSDSAPF